MAKPLVKPPCTSPAAASEASAAGAACNLILIPFPWLKIHQLA